MEKEVLRYEDEPIVKGQIVFYGPSNFTRWSRRWNHVPLREAIVGKSGQPCCINRGFGSSCAEHQLYYYHRMIRPLEPKVLVYTPFGNYKGFGYSVEEIWELAQRVLMYTLTDFPDAHVYTYGSKVPYTETEENMERAIKCNELVKEFCENTPNCFYANIFDYEPLHRKDIYVDDHVHYNQEGYHLYADFFREILKDELEQF